MSKSVEEMLKEMAAFAEKASAAAKADVLIKTAPTEVLQRAFRAACNVAAELAKGELKPENVPTHTPDLALIIMGCAAAKCMGVDPKELFGRKESPEKTSGEVGGEAGKPETHRHEIRGEVHVFTGTRDEIMAKIDSLMKSDN